MRTDEDDCCILSSERTLGEEIMFGDRLSWGGVLGDGVMGNHLFVTDLFIVVRWLLCRMVLCLAKLLKIFNF